MLENLLDNGMLVNADNIRQCNGAVRLGGISELCDTVVGEKLLH